MKLSSRLVSKISAALLVLAMLLLILPFYPVLILAAAIGTAASVVLLYMIIDQREALRFSWLLGTSLLVGYAGGTLSTWLSSVSFDDFYFLSKQRPLPLLSETLAFVYVCVGLILIAGRLEPEIFESEEKLAYDPRFAALVSLLGLVLIAFAYAVGDLGFEGVQTDVNSQRVPVLGAAAVLIVSPLAGLFGFMYGRAGRIWLRLYSAIGGCCAILALVLAGRRQIILGIIMLGLGYSLAGGLRRWSLPRKLSTAALVLGIGSLASAFFFAMRLSAWELGPVSSIGDQLSLALDFLTSPALESRFDAMQYENLRERTFILGYLADLIEATQRSGWLDGQALLFYLKLSIPSVLDPSKVDTLAIRQIENFAHPQLGLPVIDQANTILTDGVTDFGMAGGAIYLAAIVILLFASARLFRKLDKPLTKLIVGLTMIHLALKPEITLSEYLVPIRDLIWIVPVLFACEYLWGTTFSSRLVQPR